MGETTGDSARAVPGPPRLQVGGVVAGGRYELLERHGGVAGQSFWKARDRRLGRPVALTFVDPLPGEEPPGSATGVLDRTVALTAVYSDGLARVLDVIRGRAGGIVVTEWVPGRSLADAVTEPAPDAAVEALWGISDAATRTEDAGLALGLDSPDRVRVTEDGRAVLAFPGVSAEADGGAAARRDVRGLGAVLYALLTGTWPLDLPEGSGAYEHVDGRPGQAPRDDDDEVVDPTEVRPGVSTDSAVLAMRSLDGSAVSSAATVLSMVTDRTGGPVRAAGPASGGAHSGGAHSGGSHASGASDSAASTAGSASAGAVAGGLAAGGAAAGGVAALSSSSSSSSPSATSGGPASSGTSTTSGAPGTSAARSDTSDTAGSSDYSRDDAGDGSWSDAPGDPDPDVQRRRWMIMAGAGAAAVVAIVVLSVWMLGALSGNQNDTPLSQQLDAIERAAQASRSSEAAAPTTAEEGSGDGANSGDEDASEEDAPAVSPLSVSTVTSWQPDSSNGNAENSASAPNVIDGDPSTSWSTDTYRNQFGSGPGAYKPGIGLMFTLEDPGQVREVEIAADADIRFEIRASDSASPSSLDDTTRLRTGTVEDGTATVRIDDADEAEYILVWITRLGSVGPQAYEASISEVELLG